VRRSWDRPADRLEGVDKLAALLARIAAQD
jgi:hypothetical protein